MTEARGPVPAGVRLGVDVGSVRVGLSGSDPNGVIATPIATLARSAADSSAQTTPADVARIVSEVRERGAAIVYVGLPVHLSGAEGSASAAARAYAGSLARAVHPVEVRLVDERMSTVSAHQAMRAAGRPGRRQRAVVDQVAAVVILQAALDAERATGAVAGELVQNGHDGHDGRREQDEG